MPRSGYATRLLARVARLCHALGHSIRTTLCTPVQDSSSTIATTASDPKASSYKTPGSAHSAGINAVYADGSVTTINYDISAETFNCLGHREDGQAVSVQ